MQRLPFSQHCLPQILSLPHRFMPPHSAPAGSTLGPAQPGVLVAAVPGDFGGAHESGGPSAALSVAGGSPAVVFLGTGLVTGAFPGTPAGWVAFVGGGGVWLALVCCLVAGLAPEISLPGGGECGGGGLRRVVAPRRGGDLHLMPGRGGVALPGGACAGILGGGGMRCAALHRPGPEEEPTSSGSTDMALLLRETGVPAALLERGTPLYMSALPSHVNGTTMERSATSHTM
jgi:hypothetical protein